ncbi:MAG: HAD family hydrolase [Myxococcota bacterium]
MLLLFDIDGTLVDTGGAGRRALTEALRIVCGVDDGLEGVRLHGSTDRNILADAFQKHVGRPLDGVGEWSAIIDTYVGQLQEELQKASEYVVLDGARALPEACRSAGRFAVGIATGNVEQAAQLKLEPGGLWPLFDFGGYGSDAAQRADLVRRGIARGQAHAEARWGRRFADDEVVVLGDTEKDVLAAKAVGALSVGVLKGSRHKDALEASKPDLLVDSLMDSRLWKHLGLTPSN